MSDKMPESMDEEAVREWVWELAGRGEGHLARAVLALVAAKVWEAVEATKDAIDDRWCECDNAGTGGRIHVEFDRTDAIVSRVLGRDGGAR